MKRKRKVYIALHQVSYSNALHRLFHETSLALHAAEKVGLIGFNGAGKSTLLHLLTKRAEPTDGSISYAHSLRFYLVEQSFPERLLGLSLTEAVLEVLPPEERLSEQWRAESLLDQMGCTPDMWGMSCGQLSGGLQTRILLTRAQLYEPNVLLLDEPSNHLDIQTIIWLEQFLLGWRGSVIIISHDTHLLDTVTQCSWIIASGTIHRYSLPCTQALLEHAKAEQTAHMHHKEEQKDIKRLEESAQRLARWGKEQHSESSSNKAQSMFKRIEKMKKEKTEPPTPYPWNLSLPGQTLKAKRMLWCEEMKITSPDQKQLLCHISGLMIRPGEKIALIGANGTGKSTLLWHIWHSYQNTDSPCSPELHPMAVLSYYDQMQNSVKGTFSLTDALIEYCHASRVHVTDGVVQKALLGAGFQWERFGHKVNTLSGGEKARLMFAGISLMNSHMLLLDEPTNHLDLPGKQALAEQLRTLNSALLLVSHDRWLVEETCQRFLTISKKKLFSFKDPEKAYALLGEPGGKEGQRERT